MVYSLGWRPEWGDVAWSPDGQQILCWYWDGSEVKGILINADGSGEPETLEANEISWWWINSNFWPFWRMAK